MEVSVKVGEGRGGSGGEGRGLQQLTCYTRCQP